MGHNDRVMIKKPDRYIPVRRLKHVWG